MTLKTIQGRHKQTYIIKTIDYNVGTDSIYPYTIMDLKTVILGTVITDIKEYCISSWDHKRVGVITTVIYACKRGFSVMATPTEQQGIFLLCTRRLWSKVSYSVLLLAVLVQCQ